MDDLMLGQFAASAKRTIFRPAPGNFAPAPGKKGDVPDFFH
jgi:hypothetical protein